MPMEMSLVNNAAPMEASKDMSQKFGMKTLLQSRPNHDKLGMKTLLQSRPWKSLKGAYSERSYISKCKARPVEEAKQDIQEMTHEVRVMTSRFRARGQSDDVEISVTQDVEENNTPREKPAVPGTPESEPTPGKLTKSEAAEAKVAPDGMTETTPLENHGVFAKKSVNGAGFESESKDASPTSHLQWLLSPTEAEDPIQNNGDARATKQGGLSREMLRARGHKSLEAMRTGKNFDRCSLQALGESVLSEAVQRTKQTEICKASQGLLVREAGAAGGGSSFPKPEPHGELRPPKSSSGYMQPPGAWGSSGTESPVYILQDASCRVPQGFNMPQTCQQHCFQENLHSFFPAWCNEAKFPFLQNISTDSPRFVDCKDNALFCPATSGIPMKIDVSSLVSVKVMG